jgi:hypothetical protein
MAKSHFKTLCHAERHFKELFSMRFKNIIYVCRFDIQKLFVKIIDFK